MKARNIVLIVLAVLIVLSPSIALTACYLHSRSVQAEIVTASIKDATGESKLYKKGDELFALFKNTLGTDKDKPTALPALPEKALSFKRYEVLFSDSFNAESSYTYYISDDPSNCYYVDGENHPYRISKGSAEAFLNSDYSEQVYASSVPPTAAVGDKTLTAYTIDWNFRTVGGTMRKSSASYADRNESTDLESFALTFPLEFSIKPDSVALTVKEKESGTELYSGDLAGLADLPIEGFKVVTVDLTAVWKEAEDKENAGTAKYFFEGKLYGSSAFKLSDTAATCGDVLILSAFNIIDPADVTVTTDPAIPLALNFVKVGESWQTLVPIPADAVSVHTKVTFTVSTPSAIDVFLVDIAPLKASASTYYGNQKDVFNETTLNSLKETTDSILNKQSNLIFGGGKFVLPVSNYFDTASASNAYPYYTKVTLNGLGKTYTALETMYCAWPPTGTEGNYSYKTKALAAFDGTVVYVGTTTLTGKMVVVDHGSGLLSWYMNLAPDEVLVKTGDKVAAGQQIGFASAGGLNVTQNYSYRVAVTANGVGVNIDSLIAKGLIAERY